MTFNALKILKISTDYRLLEIFVIAIISSLPMAFLSSNIVVWLKESGIEIAYITLLTFTKLPSSLRFLWSPFVDNYSPRFISNFGTRKNWFLWCAFITGILIFFISTLSPHNSFSSLFIICILITFVSATYDINFDAYRVELFGVQHQALGAAAAVLGYRAGVNIVNFGGLGLANYTGSWSNTIKIVSLVSFFTVIAILIVVQNKQQHFERKEINITSLKQIFFSPFRDFFTRKHAMVILSAIILYRTGEALTSVVILPYYLDIGFSKSQISDGVRIFGFCFSIFGVCVGAFVMYIFNPYRGLVFSGIAQLGMIIILLWLKGQELHVYGLYISIIIENTCEGIASVALMSFISTVCNKKYLASQYAFLIGLSGIFGNTICSYAGKLVELLGWERYFIFAILVSLPSLMLFIYLDLKKPAPF